MRNWQWWSQSTVLLTLEGITGKVTDGACNLKYIYSLAMGRG
jgi:hypothetical protein